MSNPIIQVNNLSFSYEKHRVLRDVSFTVNARDFVAVIGSNGSGKSTLMRLMLGLMKPEGGEVELFGSNVQDLKNYASVGYVPQGGLLQVSAFPATVMEIILLRLPKGNFFNFKRKDRVEEVMKTLRHVGMEDYANRLLSTLSGGQLQRVLIARELMMNPEILFLDEPTSGLDKESIESLYTLLDHINEVHDITIILITHQLDHAQSRINRVLEVFDNTVSEVKSDVSL